jgi:hypothetical protein
MDYLRAHDGPFAARWRHGRWHGYELIDADTREVAVARGRGWLEDVTPLGASVRLQAVERGITAVVRTNFHPAWQARAGIEPVMLFSQNGQLAFRVPFEGDGSVRLEYPRRRALLWLALGAFSLGVWLIVRTGS